VVPAAQALAWDAIGTYRVQARRAPGRARPVTLIVADIAGQSP